MIDFVDINFGKDSNYSNDDIKIAQESFINQPQFSINMNKNFNIYGLGETPGSLTRNNSCSVFYNTDNPGHKYDNPMYKHLPIILLYSKDNKYLIWTNSTYQIEIYCELTAIYIKSHNIDGFNLNILSGNFIGEIYKQFYEIEGKPFVPPMWSLGYHQSKYSYYSDQEVRTIINTFDKYEIPIETIWLDIDYMEDYKVFTTNKASYGKLKNMIGNCKIVTILDPAIKLGYDIEKDGTDKDIWVKNSNNDSLVVEVWAGESYLPDFTTKKCRDWWSQKVGEFANSNNIVGLWVDMNEPTTLCKKSTNPDPNAIHIADQELGGLGLHSKYHNIYGYLMSKSTYDGLKNARPNKRPFVLTRSTKIGGQKYAAVWTGDNCSSWDHLHESIRMCLNLSISGIPFCGVDIGGFLENCNDELFNRWIGIGAWFPFFRNHTNNFTRPQEIWSFSNKCVMVCKEAICRRYSLMRYLYTWIVISSMFGEPFLKPVFWDENLNLAQYQETSFIIGGLLIIPNLI